MSQGAVRTRRDLRVNQVTISPQQTRRKEEKTTCYARSRVPIKHTCVHFHPPHPHRPERLNASPSRVNQQRLRCVQELKRINRSIIKQSIETQAKLRLSATTRFC
ncbi:unnamed protein product [Gadus morhua 'NCC']